MGTPFFDEYVNLAVVGGGFLRTPYLHATNPVQDRQTTSTCGGLKPEIIHIPAAHRKSGLNLSNPVFRRAIITSTLANQVSQDQAAQSNQEVAGTAFKFHDQPHRNIARAILNDQTILDGDRALILDTHPDLASLFVPDDVNRLGDTSPSVMPTGFLVFISRTWSDQRHTGADLLSHKIPLHYDVDLDIVYLGGLGDDTGFMLPVWGSTGEVKAWDSRMGPESYSAMGSPILGGGTVTVLLDGNGLPYLQISLSDSDLSTLPIAIQDDSGQVYSRSLVVTDAYPTPPSAALPSGRIGTPYHAVLPPETAYLHYTTNKLPPGLTRTGNVIMGTPTVYGGNYSISAEIIDLAGETNQITFWMAINRYPRTIMSILDTEGNDHHAGEYYALQFMPYGTCLAYGGEIFEFRRSKSATEHWPAVRNVRYVHGHASRTGALDAEAVWRATGAIPSSP